MSIVMNRRAPCALKASGMISGRARRRTRKQVESRSEVRRSRALLVDVEQQLSQECRCDLTCFSAAAAVVRGR